MLALEKFIEQNKENWLELIQQPPYNIKISRDDGYILLKYQQTAEDTDWYSPIVKECRGIILDELNDYKVVCHAFDRFYNYGEPYAAEIDWNSEVKVKEKVDGSLIKIWTGRDGDRRISTNGSIDAYKVKLTAMSGEKTDMSFGSLVESLLPKEYSAEKNETDMFELVSPYNQVVLEYDEPKLYYLGTRLLGNNEIFHYQFYSGYFYTPFTYSVEKDIDKIKELVANLKDAEGVVVSDEFGNKIKVKTLDYFIKHRNIAHLHIEDVVSACFKNEQEEFMTVLNKNQKQKVEKVYCFTTLFDAFLKGKIEEYEYFSVDRISFAKKYADKVWAPFIFHWYNGRDIADWKNFPRAEKQFIKVMEYYL